MHNAFYPKLRFDTRQGPIQWDETAIGRAFKFNRGLYKVSNWVLGEYKCENWCHTIFLEGQQELYKL